MTNTLEKYKQSNIVYLWYYGKATMSLNGLWAHFDRQMLNP